MFIRVRHIRSIAEVRRFSRWSSALTIRAPVPSARAASPLTAWGSAVRPPPVRPPLSHLPTRLSPTPFRLPPLRDFASPRTLLRVSALDCFHSRTPVDSVTTRGRVARRHLSISCDNSGDSYLRDSAEGVNAADEPGRPHPASGGPAGHSLPPSVVRRLGFGPTRSHTEPEPLSVRVPRTGQRPRSRVRSARTKPSADEPAVECFPASIAASPS